MPGRGLACSSGCDSTQNCRQIELSAVLVRRRLLVAAGHELAEAGSGDGPTVCPVDHGTGEDSAAPPGPRPAFPRAPLAPGEPRRCDMDVALSTRRRITRRPTEGRRC